MHHPRSAHRRTSCFTHATIHSPPSLSTTYAQRRSSDSYDTSMLSLESLTPLNLGMHIRLLQNSYLVLGRVCGKGPSKFRLTNTPLKSLLFRSLGDAEHEGIG